MSLLYDSVHICKYEYKAYFITSARYWCNIMIGNYPILLQNFSEIVGPNLGSGPICLDPYRSY